MKKYVLWLLIGLLTLIYLIFVTYKYFPYAINKNINNIARDQEFASEIRAIRNSKGNWQPYDSSDSGFSLMIPPNTVIRPSDSTQKNTMIVDTFEFESQDDNAIFIEPLNRAKTDSIRISKIHILNRRNYTKTEVVNGSERKYFNEIPMSNSTFCKDYILVKDQGLKFFEKTKLVKILDNLMLYCNPLNDDISLFSIGDGSSYDWFYRDTILPIKKSEAKPEIYQLNLDIIKTITFP